VENTTQSQILHKKILGIRLAHLTLNQALNAAEQKLDALLTGSLEGGYICIVNVHTLTESQENPALKDAYERSSLNFADGMPLVWFSKVRLQEPLPERVCGPDFSQQLMLKRKDLVYGFIGGQPGQAEMIAERFGVRFVAYCPPIRAFSPENAKEDWAEFLKLNQQQNPNGQPPAMIWVGLGAPKQELWMKEVSALAPGSLFCGIGAAFDFHSGRIRRAPRWMQHTGLEWAHRLFQDPKRLWKRYLTTNSKFLGLVIYDLWHDRKDL